MALRTEFSHIYLSICLDLCTASHWLSADLYAASTDLVMSQVIQTYEGHPTYSCAKCSAVVALQDETISKSFSGRDGRGFLMQSATNVKLGSKEERPLLTGVHTVADVFCLGCNERLGWYYHKASEYAQKYKEGKYLLEREKLIKENAWQLEE
ncbi:yippee-domain-containingprotein [Moniliophthora roreri MCA 2997]|uniref:Protein yippee-like n=1 Tax=Moniliophthora roreri (strain MCA 2997) TaxID=1381753 RepID=V2XHR0_MONRO|nr:yippee-domain-containingprotein [Moniliophthora roreri MCA 2997]